MWYVEAKLSPVSVYLDIVVLCLTEENYVPQCQKNQLALREVFLPEPVN